MLYDSTDQLFFAVVAAAEAKGLLKQQVTLTPLVSMKQARLVELRGFYVDNHYTVCAVVARDPQSHICELVHYSRIKELGLNRV